MSLSSVTKRTRQTTTQRDADTEAIRLGHEAAARIRAREQAARAERPKDPRADFQRDSQAFEANLRAVAATGLLLSSPAAPYLLWQSWAVQSGLFR